MTPINVEMKNCFMFVLLVFGVFGDPDEVKTVLEGDSVTLHTNLTDIQKDDEIRWRFGPDDSSSLIAHIENLILNKAVADERFKERLQISNIKTGDLTIKNMRIKHSGLYKAQIVRLGTGTEEKSFSIVVYGVPHLTDPSAGESKTVLKTEGDSVTLDTGVQTQRGDLILWRFGNEGVLIAKDDKEDNKTSVNKEDERFSGRLKLDDKTGSLIISDVRSSDSGEYKLKISSNSNQTLYKRFIVSVGGRGLSAGQVTGIICGVLLVIAVAGVIMYRRIKYEQQKHKVKVMRVPEGHSVTLETHVTKFPSDDVIQWSFRDEVIASFSKNNMIFTDDERFMDRQPVDDQTGSLIIRHIRTEDAGLYKVKISSSSRLKSFLQFISGGGPSHRQFNVLVTERIKSVILGGSATLETDITEIQTDDKIQWRFGDEETLIALMTVGTKPSYVSTDTRFRNRLMMNPKNGHLTITNITTELTGVYRANIYSSRGSKERDYRVAISVFTYTGESVTLNTNSEIQRDSEIKWISEDKTILVTGKNGDNKETEYKNDERFRGRLEMNPETGDLTITHIRQRDEGLYTLQQINSDGKISCRIFSVCVKERIIPVELGGSVTQDLDVTEIQRDDVIQWRFGDEEPLIAKMTVGTKPSYDSTDERFRNRLKMDPQTGHLTITDITSELSGVYRAKISSSRGTTYRTYRVVVSERIRSVRLEGSVTLETDITEIQRDDVIQWRFENEETLIAEMTVGTKPSYYSTDERFRNRLKLDQETGDLIISNIISELSGVYKAQIISSSRGTEYRTYRVVVSARRLNQKKLNSGTEGNETTVVMPLMNEAEDRF